MFSFNSLTAFSLLFISFVSIRGSLNHLLKFLPPIDVDVLSKTHNKVPFFDLSLIFSVISKFLLAFTSNDMYLEIWYIVILFIWSKLVIWVCSIYSTSAFIADVANSLCSMSSIFWWFVSSKLNLSFIISGFASKNLLLNFVT